MKLTSLLHLALIIVAIPICLGMENEKASKPIHDIAITDISAPSACKKGDIVPVTISLANQGTRREAFRVMLTDIASGKEIASQEVVLAKGWKDGSEGVADLTLAPPSSSRSDFGWGINVHGDINRDGNADLLVGSCMWDNGRGRVCLYYGGKDMGTNPDVVLEGENSDNRFALPVFVHRQAPAAAAAAPPTIKAFLDIFFMIYPFGCYSVPSEVRNINGINPISELSRFFSNHSRLQY